MLTMILTQAGNLAANAIGSRVSVEVEGGAVITDTLTGLYAEGGVEVQLTFKNTRPTDITGFNSSGFTVPVTRDVSIRVVTE